MAKARIEGMNKLRAKLDQLQQQIIAGAKDGTEATVDAVYNEARSNVPVDTGTLRDSITRTSGEGGLSGEVGIAGAGTEYAGYIEFGTSRRPPRPFMTPAGETERARFGRRVADAVKRKAQ